MHDSEDLTIHARETVETAPLPVLCSFLCRCCDSLHNNINSYFKHRQLYLLILTIRRKRERTAVNLQEKKGYLAFARLSEEPFHWCFPPNVSSALAAVPSALGTCS